MFDAPHKLSGELSEVLETNRLMPLLLFKDMKVNVLGELRQRKIVVVLNRLNVPRCHNTERRFMQSLRIIVYD